MNKTQEEAISRFALENEMPLLALVPFDTKITEADMLGETPLKHKDICETLLKKSI